MRITDDQRIHQRRQIVGELVGHARCTKMRCVEMQDWPACEKPATLILSAAFFQSPSAAMMTGALFPNSRPTCLRGARCLIPQPTSG